MEARNISLTEMTYQYVIQRLVRAEALELCLQGLAEMGERQVVPSLKTMFAIIQLACQLSHSRLAIDLAVNFEQSSPRLLDAQTWYTCLIAAADTLYVSSSHVIVTII